MPKDGVGKVALISRRLKSHALERRCVVAMVCAATMEQMQYVFVIVDLPIKTVPCLIAQKVAQVTVYAIETHCNVPVIQSLRAKHVTRRLAMVVRMVDA